MDRDKVLQQYKGGDDGRRLGLFLTYRELREEFLSIEQAGQHDDFRIIELPWSRKGRAKRAA